MDSQEYMESRRVIKELLKTGTDEALAEAGRMVHRLLESQPYNVDLLQSQFFISHLTDAAEVPLDRTLEPLALAHKILPDYVPLVIELGYWEYAMNTSCAAAQAFFIEAADASAKQWIESQIGIVKCYIDEGRAADARKIFGSVKRIAGEMAWLSDNGDELDALLYSLALDFPNLLHD